jgi:Trp operon repressor
MFPSIFYNYIIDIDIDMFNYSTQATTYLILVIITSIINLICYYLLLGMWGFVGYLLYVIITVPIIILWMYNIDCLTSGDCQIWSWVITALTLVSVISTTVILVAIAVNPTLSNGLLNKWLIFKPVIETSPEQPSVIITTVPASPATPATPAATTTTVITGTAVAAATTPAATNTAPTVSEADNTHNTNFFKKMWEDDKQFMEQQFQKQKYISAQFERKDLTRDEKNALWRQQLEYEYKNLVNTEKNLQKIILNAKGFPPEIMEQYRNMSKINQRLIQQREKMTVEYPAFVGTFNPEKVESIKLQIKLNIEQKQIIQQELLKAGLTNDEKKALEQQLVILQKLHDELPPREGTVLYDAYIASNK